MTPSNTYPAIIRDLTTGEELLQVEARIKVSRTEAGVEDWKGWFIQPDGIPALDLGQYQLDVPGKGKGTMYIANRPAGPAAGKTIQFKGTGTPPV